MKDQIIKFFAYNGKISVVCCSTTNLEEKEMINQFRKELVSFL